MMKNLFLIWIVFLPSLLCSQKAIWETRNSGTLGEAKFKLSNLDKEENELYDWDFINRKKSEKPLSKEDKSCAYAGSDNWKLTFNKKVRGLTLHIGAWRPGVYRLSTPFSVSRAKNFRAIGNYIIIERTEKGSFGNGSITFKVPLCCLFIESSTIDDSPQIMTFSLDNYHNYPNFHLTKFKNKTLADRLFCNKIRRYFRKRKYMEFYIGM